MAVTLQDLTNRGYDFLREDEDVRAYPLTFMQDLMNSAQLRICSGRVKNPFKSSGDPDSFIRKGQLPFLNGTKFYPTYRDISLDVLAVVGASTLSSSDSSGMPATGALYLNGNLCPYTGNTGTGFTGVSNILYAHKAGTNVGFAYDLPTDHMSPKNMIYQHSMKLPMKRYDDIFEAKNSIKGGRRNINRYNNTDTQYNDIGTFYSIIDDTYVVFFNIDSSNEFMMFRYEIEPTAMTAVTTPAFIPNDVYAKSTIPYIAIGEMFYNRGEEKRGADILNFGLGQVQEMYDYYNNKSYEDINGVQYGMGKGRLNV